MSQLHRFISMSKIGVANKIAVVVSEQVVVVVVDVVVIGSWWWSKDAVTLHVGAW